MLARCISGLIAFGVIATSGIAHAQAATQFDLKCTGSIADLLFNGPQEPWAVNLRVNLVNNTICENACDQTLPLTVGPADLQTEYFDHGMRHLYRIDRTRSTLAMGIYGTNNKPMGYATATCDVAPFTGMPSNKF